MAEENSASEGGTPEERAADALEKIAQALGQIVKQLSTLNANAQGLLRTQTRR